MIVMSSHDTPGSSVEDSMVVKWKEEHGQPVIPESQELFMMLEPVPYSQDVSQLSTDPREGTSSEFTNLFLLKWAKAVGYDVQHALCLHNAGGGNSLSMCLQMEWESCLHISMKLSDRHSLILLTRFFGEASLIPSSAVGHLPMLSHHWDSSQLRAYSPSYSICLPGSALQAKVDKRGHVQRACELHELPSGEAGKAPALDC
nr:uncharacterized protein LOC112547451 [Pelodiscus sinensis]|eukprot:XP_025045432.1 uncharacterized protein LOC112547451 [Pelodiscus sinensis]